MSKKLFGLLAFTFLLSVLYVGLGSAYAYGGVYGGSSDYVNAYSYSSSRTTGNYGWLQTRDVNYNRNTVGFYDWDGSYVKQTTYVKTVRESPYYSSGYSGYNGNYGPNYYGSNPWGYGGYGGYVYSAPRYQYVYRY